MWKSSSCWNHIFDNHTSSKYQIQKTPVSWQCQLCLVCMPCSDLFQCVYLRPHLWIQNIHLVLWCVPLKRCSYHFCDSRTCDWDWTSPCWSWTCFIHAIERISITTFNTSIYSTVYQTLTSDVQSQISSIMILGSYFALLNSQYTSLSSLLLCHITDVNNIDGS